MNRKRMLLVILSSVIAILMIGVIFVFYSIRQNGASFSIIGGADGPTSIFIAGKFGGKDKNEDREKPDMKAEVITAAQAKEIIDGDENYVILDVREADEFTQGHIKNAIQLSYTEIETKAEELLPDKEQLILIYCRSGRRSAIAASSLVSLGYTNIKDFGGIIDWPYDVEK